MKTISYFSYKGGSGRSSLIYNTIPFLVEKLHADEKHPIILVDLDVDSAGLSFILKNEILDNENSSKITTNELISDDNMREMRKLKIKSQMEGGNITSPAYAEFYNRLERVGSQFGIRSSEFVANDSVLFVPAKPDFNRETNFDRATNTSLMDFVDFASSVGCSAVIFDMPAGEQVVGQTAFQLSDIVLVCFRITKQHRQGTIDFMKRNVFDKSNTKFVLVPSVVPDTNKPIMLNGGYFNFEVVKNLTINKIKDIFIEKNGNADNLVTSMLEGEWYGIPEVARFKFEEGILYEINSKLRDGETLTEDEQKAYKAYEYLSDVIVNI